MLRINPNGTLTALSIPTIYSGTTYSGLESMSDSFVLCATQPSDLQTPQIKHSHPLTTNPRGNREPQQKSPEGSNGSGLDLESKFDFLSGRTRKTAIKGYKSVMRLLNSVEILPHTVWVDIDGTLINYRKKRGQPTVFQGRIIGLMQAFRDSGVKVGLFSYQDKDSIRNFLNRNGQIAKLLSDDENKEPLIRDIDHINNVASLLETADGSICYGMENGFGLYYHLKDMHVFAIRVPKFLGIGEILIDDAPNHNEFNFIMRSRKWNKTELAIRIANSKKRIVKVNRARHLDESRRFSIRELRQLSKILRLTTREMGKGGSTQGLFARLRNLLER